MYSAFQACFNFCGMKKIKVILAGLVLSLYAGDGFAQEKTNNIEGKKVASVEIRDDRNNPLMLPRLGETNLLIFYVDPDHAGQNQEFMDYLEQHSILCSTIDSYGVVNLEDAPLLPNGIIRSIVRKKSKSTGGVIYFDPDYSLRDGWGMGDVNNKFILIFVNKDCVVEFFRYGDFTEKDITDFYKVVDKYYTKDE